VETEDEVLLWNPVVADGEEESKEPEDVELGDKNDLFLSCS
jgi:hypothetical protein